MTQRFESSTQRTIHVCTPKTAITLITLQGTGNPEDGIFVPDTDEGGNYIPASVDDPDYYVGEAPHWYQETYFSDYGTCGHGCSEDTVDEVSLTANTTYIIQIAANYAGRRIQGGPCADTELPDGSCLFDSRSPTFVSIAVGGVGAATDRPTAASTAVPTPVPTLPLFGFGHPRQPLGTLWAAQADGSNASAQP